MTRATKSTHGGKRKGAGRKPVPNSEPERTKKFRANEKEWKEFLLLLSGGDKETNSRVDFLIVLDALRRYFAGNPNDR